ncbi:hypothetical protein KJ039_07485 [bacterium]|nr:hypothetical protein [bacterium]
MGIPAKVTALAALFIWFAGCAAILPVEPNTFTTDTVSYSIGQVHERNTGEAIAVEEKLIVRQALVAVSDFTPPRQAGAEYPSIRKGMELRPYGKLPGGGVLYTNKKLRPRTSLGKQAAWEYCVAVDEKGAAYGDAACALGLVRVWEPRPEGVLKMKAFYKRGSLRRELSYSGRQGNSIRMAYREYRRGMDVPSVSEELVYDLPGQGLVRFKGMEIEVLEATRNGIRYIVRSRMDGTIR